MGVFFNGRLIKTPTTASVVDDSGLENKNLSVGNVAALIGRASGGKPNTPLRFGTPAQARAVLRDGEMLRAVIKAFDPSSQTGGPQEVVAIRVNPAVQGSLALKDAAAATVINLLSTDYGLYTNQIKVKLETGSVSGKKVTVQLGDDYISGDNVARNAFKIRYSGAQATANMSITSTTLTLQAPTGTNVASIDLATYPTVQQVVDRINAVADFSATAQDGNGAKATVDALDYVAAQDVKTADYTALANLQAVIDFINSTAEGYLDATRATNVGTVPANIPFTYLAGGSDGVTTNTNWSDAYTTLQKVDVQWVSPISPDPSIHAMNDTHCSFMSNQGKMERRGIVGMSTGQTTATGAAAAKALNSDRTSLVHVGFYDYNDDGALTLYPPYIMAGALSGMFSGVNPGTPLTNKAVKVVGLEFDVRNPTDTDELIDAGVLCIENTKNGYKIVQSITTWLVNDNYNRVEVSTGVAIDYVARNVREALDVLRGEKATPLILSRAKSITDSRLRELARAEPQGPGVITGDDANPAYKNIRASIEADVLRVEFECQPVIGVNYVLVSIFAKAYSGSTAST